MIQEFFLAYWHIIVPASRALAAGFCAGALIELCSWIYLTIRKEEI